MLIKKMLDFSKSMLNSILVEGDVVVDATAGNGYDTLFLSQKVGESGKVYAFDIQETAIASTKEILDSNRCSDNVCLLHDGHENIGNYFNPDLDGKLKAAVFNLGYLPGKQKEIVTKSDTTLTAVKFCVTHLQRGGLISIAVYAGHEGGREEAEIIKEWVVDLPKKRYVVLEYNFINELKYPHHLILIEKR